jgi:hypothetical protein
VGVNYWATTQGEIMQTLKKNGTALDETHVRHLITKVANQEIWHHVKFVTPKATKFSEGKVFELVKASIPLGCSTWFSSEDQWHGRVIPLVNTAIKNKRSSVGSAMKGKFIGEWVWWTVSVNGTQQFANYLGATSFHFLL